MTSETLVSPSDVVASPPLLRRPRVADGQQMWRVARDSVRLDLNPPYAYLLWARDFAETSVVAEADGEVLGFVSGFRRPEAPDTLMVWQVAVDERLRGQGTAGNMLDELVEHTGVHAVETTVTDDNPASAALFESLARRHGARHEVTELFDRSDFPDDDPWNPEFLHRIAPLGAAR